FAAENAAAVRAQGAPRSGAPLANSTRDSTDAVSAPPATPAVPRAPASRVAVIPPTTPAPAAAAPTPAPPPSIPLPKTPMPAVTTPVAPLPAVTTPVAPPPVPADATPSDEIPGLLARAKAYLSAGDLAAARLVLRRAAELDDPQAAFALA